jgi:glyoxylase-like metal-dependent hydrolase (beta-lactamase superfamily II)
MGGLIPLGRNKMTYAKHAGSLTKNAGLILCAAGCAAAAFLLPAPARAADTDPCDSLIPAAIGGPLLPKTSETAVFRWLANANYEIDYRGQIFLFDTYYDRKARNRPLGFTADQVKRASVIFLGHGHFDHMSDTVPVAAQTQAPVVGAPITIATRWGCRPSRPSR